MIDWLKSLPKPIGLMTCVDDRSQHVFEACQLAGLRVPNDVAILGVDNDEVICNMVYPPLSSIALNLEKAGYEAAHLLDKMMNNHKIDNRTLLVGSSRVVTRQSTDIIAVEDEIVIDAIRYIQQNVKKAIQVHELADAVAVSRRSLERRFRVALGCSILEEIRRVRVDHISRLLVETDRSILRIARTFGFTGVDHISRYFRKEKGIGPRAYRKRYGAE